MPNRAKLALFLGTLCLMQAADLETTFQSLKDAVAKKDVLTGFAALALGAKGMRAWRREAAKMRQRS